MSAGTITLTNKSAVVSGNGTSFTTELSAGDFIVVTVGGIPYTLPVKTVNSNTSLTLVSNFTGPTQSGAAWYAVPRIAMNLVTADVVTQAAEALRGLNYDKQNWQQVFSGTGNVTVKLPDGSTYPGPAWGGITSTLSGKMDKNQNLSDVGDRTMSRKNLGLGSSATRDAYSSAGLMLSQGDFGVGGTGSGIGWNIAVEGRFLSSSVDAPTDSVLFMGINCAHGSDPSYCFQLGGRGNRGMWWRAREAAIFQPWLRVYDTGNTTKASDGTLKAASPVARIVISQEACQRTDIAEDGFSWCGSGTANAEAEGINLSRLDVGVYALTGSSGLASDGWQLLPPMDPGGTGELGVVEAEKTENDGLIIRLFKRKYMLSEEGEIVKTKGQLIDVPANSWIDIRLDMPADSIWNQRQSEVREAMEKAEHEREQTQQDVQ
ncbi:phage tail fiber protein [Citrobacter portucalensis]|uniref:phage tail fiber protein n=1 Tax=Citrobacter portucalensis TaxID=1639133 RepID=UPI0040335035